MISERHTKLQVSADDLQKDLADKGVHLKRPLEELLLDLERRRILRTLKSGEQTQYEISHDVLALVVGKNLTNEMELRAKAADIYRVYEERKGFFSQEDLDLIRPYQQYKAYSSALEQRIKESEDHLHAEAQRVQRENAEKLAAEEARIAREKAEADRRRKRALLTSLVAGILVLAAVIAIIFALMKSAEAEQQAQRAQDAIALAEEKKREAAESDSVALKEKGNAQRALKYAKEAQQLADEKEKIARKAEARAQAAILQSGIDSEMARIAKQEAEDKRLEADEATRKANAAKLEAEKLALQVVSNLLPQIRRDILYLDYGAAYSKIKEASSLNALQDSLAFECMEVAWFYHHSGKDKLAREPFDLAAELLDKDMVKSRRDFSALNPERAQFLEARYFGEMVAIKGGKFYMQGDFYGGEVPVYLGVIEDFSMSKYETTVWQYNLFCAEKGWNITQRISWYSQTSLEVEKYQPSWGWLGNNPVVYVSWYDAAVYANWLSLKLGKKPAYDISMERDSLNESSSDVFGWTVTPVQNDNCYRLPTEMEWEFAAKHGLTGGPSPYSGSNILDSLAWYVENSKNRTQAVGLKKSNAAGIFDMSGNVWEWCYDWYGDLPAENALGSRKGSKRVMRGGSWGDEQGVCRVAYRSGIDPDGRHPRIGFRLVFVP
jgi:formylglycine-generating enzyme required for sulfatase activity